MSQDDNQHRSNAPWLKRRSFWVGLFVAVPIFTILTLMAWQLRRVKASNDLLDTIDSLVLLSPQDLTADEWSVAVYWTHNLHCASSPQIHANISDITHFQRDVNDRVESKVDASTILWIWGRYGRLTKSGDRYRQKFQNVMLDEMKRVAANGDIYGDYSSFAAYVREEHK